MADRRQWSAGHRYVAIDVSAIGDTPLIGAVPGKRIQLISYTIVADGAVDVRFKSGATAISGPMGLGANGGVVLTGSKRSSLLETAAGEALQINLSAAVQVSGHLTYRVVAS